MEFLRRRGIEAEKIRKVHEGSPHVVDAIRSNLIDLVINTPQDAPSQYDDQMVRRAAILHNVPYTTTMAGARAVAAGMAALRQEDLTVCALQDYIGA